MKKSLPRNLMILVLGLCLAPGMNLASVRQNGARKRVYDRPCAQ